MGWQRHLDVINFGAMIRIRAALPWLVPPTLALIAFAPVLSLWFVADDFGHLLINNRLPFPQPLLAFGKDELFYRPFSTVLTWNFSTAIFGRNALPLHAISLLAHALAALLLARLAYTVSSSKITGILAGALFAVYPLCTEPVAWLASQWDVLATVCTLGAALGFAVAWCNSLQGKPAIVPCALGLLSALLAVGMKESTLPLPAVLPFVALSVSATSHARPSTNSSIQTIEFETQKEQSTKSRIWKAIAWSLPYALPTLIFIGLRLASGAGIGGYENAPTDFQRFFWDALVTTFLAMLMPLNRLLFNATLVQVLGFLMALLFIGGLILWGRRRWPLLLLSLAWWLIFLIPALNLVVLGDNPANIQNRFYYLSFIGFCLAMASLISVPLEWPRFPLQRAAWAAITIAILAIIPATWKQLEPWLQASQQTHQVVDELTAMLPPRNDGWIEINARNLPRDYQGAYVFWNGLDTAVQVFHRQHVHLKTTSALDHQALATPLAGETGRWNLDFSFDQSSRLYHINSLSGVTGITGPPVEPGTLLWDFRTCEKGIPPGMQINNASTRCAQDRIVVLPTSSDPAIIFPGLDMDLTGVRWLRLAVSARYAAFDAPHMGQWYWAGDNQSWSEEDSAGYYLDSGQQRRVYWTYVRAADIGARLTDLRFDPVNDYADAQISWLALTPIDQEASAP